jgi:hypothetical protein
MATKKVTHTHAGPQPKSITVLGRRYTPGEYNSLGADRQAALRRAENFYRYAKMGQLLSISSQMGKPGEVPTEEMVIDFCGANPGLIEKWTRENHPSYKTSLLGRLLGR